jgi:hypothetical protein
MSHWTKSTTRLQAGLLAPRPKPRTKPNPTQRRDMLNKDLPQYDGTRLREVLDNQRPGDRYLAIFEDGTALAVRHDGRHSAWQDDLYDMDPWTLGTRTDYAGLPVTVQSEIQSRADQLHDLLTKAP